MIDRVYIWIAGTPGSGKTTLLERALESDRSRVLIAGRFSPRATEDGDVECVIGEKEPLRYAVAGAEETFLCSYPPGAEAEAARWYWETAWQRGFSDAVLYEGEEMLDLNPDLSVFVMPADPALLPLAAKREQEVLRLPLEIYLKHVLAAEGGFLPEEVGSDVSLGDESDLDFWDEQEEEVIESFEIPDELGKKLLEWAEQGVPVMGKLWKLREELADLRRARAVVINIRSEEDRPVAARISEEIHRMWADHEIVRDVRIPSWPSRPPSIYVANLADRREEGTRKAVARIKRAYQRRS